MVGSPLLAFVAGAVTILSPCVLPLLPVILSSTVQEGRARPWGVLAGFVGSFTLVTLFLAFAVQSLGISPNATRVLSAVLLIGFGLVLAVPALKHRFELATASLLPVPSGSERSGFWGGLAIGGGLGLAWTPCVGPIMASVITLALNQAVTGAAFATTLAFALGTAIPMAAVMFGGRSLVRRFSFLQANGTRIQQVFGILLVLVGLAIWTGFDRRIQVQLLQWFPNWERTLTGWEPKP